MVVKHWERILYVNEKTGASDLIMDPKDPNTLYASMWEFRRTGWGFNSGGPGSALYKSTDAGKTWNKIHNGFPEGDLGRFRNCNCAFTTKYCVCCSGEQKR